MTRSTVVLLLASMLSAPALLRWLRDDLPTDEALLRCGLATALAAAAVHLMVAVLSSYRPAPVERRRSSDEDAPAG